MRELALRCDRAGVVRALLRGGGDLPDDPLGRPLAALLDPSSLARGLDLLEDARRQGVAAGRELLVRAAGVPRVLVAACVAGEEGLLVLAATSRHALRELCERMSEEPGACVALRALDLRARAGGAGEEPVAELTRLYNELATLERELASRGAQLERLAREKDHVLTMAAHDLRNPLHAISLSVRYLELKAGARLEAVERETLARMRRSAQSMGRLVDDLLDVGNLERGAPSLQRAPVDLPALLRDVVELQATLAADRDIAVELELEDRLGPLEADGDRLRQVLVNLLSNAVDHSPAGGRVRVSARRRLREVEVAVCDSGPGVAASERTRLFRPYARGAGQRREGGSVGLGLAIARAIVESHGGVIDADDAPGGGARFWFRVPAGAEADGGSRDCPP